MLYADRWMVVQNRLNGSIISECEALVASAPVHDHPQTLRSGLGLELGLEFELGLKLKLESDLT